MGKLVKPTVTKCCEIPKGWGKEMIITNNELYCGKILMFKKGCKRSQPNTLMMTHIESQKEIVKKMKNEISNELKIAVLEKKMERLEKTIKDFMSKWGPDVQERRAKRDKVWDEMVRVISIQNKGK